MIISMKLHATGTEIDAVRARINDFGYKVHSITGEERVVIGQWAWAMSPRVSNRWKRCRRWKKLFGSRRLTSSSAGSSDRTNRRSSRDGVGIGGDDFVVMAGPCSVESEKQILETAHFVARHGAKFLRGGAFKPRTSPYDFQGMEREGLKLLQESERGDRLAHYH